MAADDPHSINIDGKNEHEREHDARTLLCEKWRRSLTSRRIRLVSLRSLKMLVIFLMATRWPVSEHVAELRTSARGTRLAPYGTEGRRMRASERGIARTTRRRTRRYRCLGSAGIARARRTACRGSRRGSRQRIRTRMDRAPGHRSRRRVASSASCSIRDDDRDVDDVGSVRDHDDTCHRLANSEQEHTALADYRGARAMRCDGDASRAAANERPSDLHHDLKSCRRRRQPANLSCRLYGTRCVTLPSSVLAVVWMYLRVFGSF